MSPDRPPAPISDLLSAHATAGIGFRPHRSLSGWVRVMAFREEHLREPAIEAQAELAARKRTADLSIYGEDLFEYQRAGDGYPVTLRTYEGRRSEHYDEESLRDALATPLVQARVGTAVARLKHR